MEHDAVSSSSEEARPSPKTTGDTGKGRTGTKVFGSPGAPTLRGGKRSEGSAPTPNAAAAQTPIAAAPPPPPPNEAGPSRQELVELLASAAVEIKSYKAKLAAALTETDRLKSRVKSLKQAASASASVSGDSTASTTTTSGLKQKLLDLSLENHVAVEQISNLRKKVVDLEAVVESQKEELGKLRSTRQIGEGVLAKESRRSNSADVSKQRPPPAPRVHSKVSAAPDRPSSPVHQDPSQGSVPKALRPYDEMMIARFRRSLAPPPTREQLGEVVHAMVGQLSKILRQKGRNLPLTKVGPCIYTYPSMHSALPVPPGGKSAPQAIATRKVHLTIDSGRLVAKCGGGHVDVLEFLDRNKVCTTAPN